MDEVFAFLGRVALGGIVIFMAYHILMAVAYFAFGDDGFSWESLGWAVFFVFAAIVILGIAYSIGNFLVGL